MITYSSKNGRFAVERDGKLVCVYDFDGFLEFKDYPLKYINPAVEIEANPDGTMVITAKEQCSFRVQGNFETIHQGRYEGELISIAEDRTGFYIYPQRNNSGYGFEEWTDSNSEKWNSYDLDPGQKILAGVFPPKKRSCKDYFDNTMITTYCSNGKGHPDNKVGDMPPDDVIAQLAKKFKILCIHDIGPYRQGDKISYDVVNKQELWRAIETAHKHDMKLIMYTSPFDWMLAGQEIGGFYEQIRGLKKAFPGLGGVYIDGVAMGYGDEMTRAPILSREIMQILRDIFPEGKLILHDSNRDTPALIGLATTPCPAYEQIADVVVRNENIPVSETDYLNYAVNPISNVQGMMVTIRDENNVQDFETTTKIALDKRLLRLLWIGTNAVSDKKSDELDRWKPHTLSADAEYMDRMEEREEFFREGKESNVIDR